MPRILFNDIETQNHTYFGALASPRHPDNYIVADGRAIDTNPFDGEITGTYFNSKEEGNAAQWLSIPDDVWLIVAHNAQFECDWYLTKQREEFMKFLKRGGRVFCTAYAEYLLSNQQETYPSLDETAPKYGGTPKVDGVKILWEQGVLTSDIDKDLLFDQYLLGPGGDIDNTRRVFYGQVQQLQERGMWDMALLRMEGLLYNIMAMDAGLHVHRGIAMAQKESQELALADLMALFKQHRTEVPDYIEFKESSDYHMSAWLYGGPIKYKIRDVWYEEDGVTPKYEKIECFKFGESYVPSTDLTPEQFQACVAQHGAPERYSAGKNKGSPKVHKINSATPKLKWYDRVQEIKGLIDLEALPKDVRKEFKAEFSGKRKLANGDPVISTGRDALDVLSKRKEFSEETKNLLVSLLEFAKIDKDLGTYYLREVADEEGNVVKQSGMLQYLTEYDIVHHVLNATATITTRLSGTRPNMQNIPRGDTSDVKKIFTSRFNNPRWLAYALAMGIIPADVHAQCTALIESGQDAGAIIEADYSALEVVTLAAFSKDANLVRALLDNIDMHCMRLAQQLGEPYEDVLLKCKERTHPEHDRYKTMRTDIKPKAFAYQYGATAMGIAFATGSTVEDAQAFIDAEKALFPDVEAWYEREVFAVIEENSRDHREMSDDGKYRLYRRGTWRSPAGTTFEFREYPKTSYISGQRVEIMAYKPTQMRNYPIQGESGFFVQGIAGQVVRWLISRDFFGGRVFIINQVHDALYLDCTLDVLHEVATTVKVIMESLPEFYKPYGYDLGVPFPAEVEAGPSMYDKEKI